METYKLSNMLVELTSGTPVSLTSSETIKTFIDETIHECIQNKVFDDNVRQALSIALDLYKENILYGLQDAVHKDTYEN